MTLPTLHLRSETKYLERRTPRRLTALLIAFQLFELLMHS